MANNIDVKFSGLVELRAAGYKYLGTDGDDCMRALHTNFYNSAYSYNSSNVTAASVTNPQNAFNRSLSDYASHSSTRTYVLNNHRIRPHAIILDMTTAGSSSALTFNVLGYNEANQFNETLTDGSQIINGFEGPITRVVFDQLDVQYTNLRRGWIDRFSLSTTSAVRLYQIYVYGEIIQEQENKLPATSGATTIEAFTDSFIDVAPISEGTIIKDGSLKLEPRKAHTIRRQTLTSTYDIPDNAQFNVWNFDPNSANRVVNLPRYPQFNHYLRINNLDGGFQIRVNDSDHSTLIQNLSNANGPNTLEAVWANDQWIITT